MGKALFDPSHVRAEQLPDDDRYIGACAAGRASARKILLRRLRRIGISEIRTMGIREARGRAPRVFACVPLAGLQPEVTDMTRRSFGKPNDEPKSRVITPRPRGSRPLAVGARRGAKAARTQLTHEQKVYVVKRLAAYDAPVVIVRGLKEEFGITVRPEVIQHYHPERAHSRTLAQHWKDLFWDTRKSYVDSTADIGADHKPVRIRWRGEMVQETWGAGQHKIANEILDSVAKEGSGAGNGHGRGHFGLRAIPLSATINIIRKPRA